MECSIQTFSRGRAENEGLQWHSMKRKYTLTPTSISDLTNTLEGHMDIDWKHKNWPSQIDCP